MANGAAPGSCTASPRSARAPRSSGRCTSSAWDGEGRARAFPERLDQAWQRMVRVLDVLHEPEIVHGHVLPDRRCGTGGYGAPRAVWGGRHLQAAGKAAMDAWGV